MGFVNEFKAARFRNRRSLFGLPEPFVRKILIFIFTTLLGVNHIALFALAYSL